MDVSHICQKQLDVKKIIRTCVSNVIMSLLTTALKCHHGREKDAHGAERVVAVASDHDGRSRLGNVKEASEKIGFPSERD